MNKKFKELHIGEKFYNLSSGTVDGHIRLIKEETISFQPEELAKLVFATERVRQNGLTNSTIVDSLDHKNDGYRDFVNPETLVFPENLTC